MTAGARQAADQLGQIVEACAKAGVVYGLEIEGNLIGGDGDTLIALYEKIGSPNCCIIPDTGNMESAGTLAGTTFAGRADSESLWPSSMAIIRNPSIL